MPGTQGPDEAAVTRRLLLAAGASSSLMAATAKATPAEDLAPLVAQARERWLGEIATAGVGGAAAALLVDGQPKWIEAFGSTGGSTGRPVDRDTIFSVQSMSKNFAATAVMMAVQRGLLDLDRPVTDYLPGFEVNSRLEDHPARKMTLRLLLSHHAGLTHEAPVGNNYIAESPSFEAHVLSIQQTWLRYRVGERYSYSNLGVDLAGYVLQRVADMPYAECLRRWLFEPLGMRNSTVAPEIYEANPNRAVGHIPGFDHVPLRIPLVPSGGVYTSIADMTRYAQFHLGRGRIEGRRVLGRREWEEMHSFRYSSDYALGVALFERRFRDRTVRMLNHNGGGFGFGSTLTYCPSEQVAWIVLFNGATRYGGGADFFPIMPEPLLRARYGPLQEPVAPRASVVTPSISALQARVGLYMNQDSRCDITVVDGALNLHFRGEPAPNRLAFLTPDEGWIIEGAGRPAPIRFRPARGGEAPAFEYPRGNLWDFIDGPAAPPGPVKAEYDDKLGTYQIYAFGKPAGRLPLAKRNGYLYLADIRLAPYRPGLLFSGQGEVVDLRGAIPTARNIQLIKVS